MNAALQLSFFPEPQDDLHRALATYKEGGVEHTFFVRFVRQLAVSVRSAKAGMPKSCRDVLRQIVDDSGMSVREFAERMGGWDPSYLAKTLSGKKSIGPTTVGRITACIDERRAAELIRAYLDEQKEIIERERRNFAR